MSVPTQAREISRHPTSVDSHRSFFRANGILSRSHPNYEYRQGQLQMAEGVEAALAENRHLMVEAGTGTGKTLAYLVPSILPGSASSSRPAQRTCRSSCFSKTCRFCNRFSTSLLAVCYMKGRANYLCRQKLYDAEREPVLSGVAEVRDYRNDSRLGEEH